MKGSFAHYGWNHGGGTKPPQLCCARETKERMVARQFFSYLLPFDTAVASRLGNGRYTAAAAFLLGAMAGELRRRSGSLVPAVICHAFFNLAGIVWP
jgi:membrane protease YdiL (CAAX protease family)